MNVIHIYMQRYARRRLRRERLYRDRGNPLEVYDEIEIKNLFRFQSPHIIQITEDVQEHLCLETKTPFRASIALKKTISHTESML